MTRRVLEVLGPSTGGIRRHVAALAQHLPESSWETDIAGPRDVMEGLVPAFAAGHVATLDVPASFGAIAHRPDRLVNAARGLRRLARPVEVVHAHGLKAGLLATSACTGRPLVLTVHNVVLDEVTGRGATVMRRVERAVISRADQVICGSADIAAMFTDLVPSDRLRWITPASADPVVHRRAAEVRAAHGIAADDQMIVAVTRLHPQKNLSLMISAFARVADDHPRARLLIVGDGPMRSALQDEIDRLGMAPRVTLAGHADNPADEMAAADIVALSSSWEGVPLAAAEALQLGRPLVMTAVGTIGVQMERDGVGGIAVPPDDVDGFAAALDALLGDRDLAERLGIAGRVVGERYRARRLVAEVAAVYGEVAR